LDAEEKNKRKGLIASVLFHSILLILFAFFGLTYLDPPPEEEGITINFGTTDFGSPSENENNPAEENMEESEPTPVEPVPTETVEEDILTQSEEEAPSIDKKEEKKEPVKEVEKKEEPKPDKNLSKALDKWKNKKSEPSGGDGETNKAGDQGALDGDPNSNNYTGGGSGNGIQANLNGRKMIKKPIIRDDSQEEGIVVVDIIVDQYGKVLRATPGARGSTTTNSHLYKKAKEAALQTKFNANPDAAEQQKGQMTFTFILN